MTQSQLKETEIDGHKYQISMLDPMSALDLFQDIAKQISPLLGGTVSGLSKVARDGLDADVTSDGGLMSAVEKTLTRWDKSVVNRMVSLFKPKTLVDGKKLDAIFDAHFHGKTWEMLKWIKWCIQAQYGDVFFGLRSAIVDGLASQALQRSPSQSNSKKGSQSGESSIAGSPAV